MKKHASKIIAVAVICMLLLSIFAIFTAADTETSAANTGSSTSSEAVSTTTGEVTDGETPDSEGTTPDASGDEELNTDTAMGEEETADGALTAEAAEEEAEEEPTNPFVNTLWALLPPVIAIVLALITKEVYSSLFVGIVAGALMFATTGHSVDFELAYNTLITDGFVASLADSWNVGILIFLVVLGVIVILVNRAGGSAAYGEWAGRHIKSRTGAILATFGLGCLIFVDDYFNCLTVGSVMRPITDTHKVSRAKLSYIIDATAAPICMIAPISSWAAAVSGVVEGTNGFTLFCKAIPYNFYSLLTIVMIIAINVMHVDFGPMKKHEQNALVGDIYTTPDRPYENAVQEKVSSRGKVIDLILPIIVLIICCILGMVYTGNIGKNSVTVAKDTAYTLPMNTKVTLDASEQYGMFFQQSFEASAEIPGILTEDFTVGDVDKASFNDDLTKVSAEGLTVTFPAKNDKGEYIAYIAYQENSEPVTFYLHEDAEATFAEGTKVDYSVTNLIDAFASSDASVGLSMGSVIALLLIILYMVIRRVVSFKDCMAALPEGFKSMVPAILILTFAWTLSGVTKMLGAKEYVSAVFEGAAGGLKSLLPAIVFLVAVGLSFATGTSWGTFGILIPIVVPLFGVNTEMLIISISACLAGAVCGDHCSPISDTTIMASTGGQCNHINHVSTQLPYALSVAAVSFVSYILAGFIQNWLIVLPIAIVLMVLTVLIIRLITGRLTPPPVVHAADAPFMANDIPLDTYSAPESFHAEPTTNDTHSDNTDAL